MWGWHTHYATLGPGFSDGDVREANLYGSFSEAKGFISLFNGLYVGGASNGSIRYYRSGTINPDDYRNGAFVRPMLPKDIDPHTPEVGRWN